MFYKIYLRLVQHSGLVWIWLIAKNLFSDHKFGNWITSCLTTCRHLLSCFDIRHIRWNERYSQMMQPLMIMIAGRARTCFGRKPLKRWFHVIDWSASKVRIFRGICSKSKSIGYFRAANFAFLEGSFFALCCPKILDLHSVAWCSSKATTWTGVCKLKNVTSLLYRHMVAVKRKAIQGL